VRKPRISIFIINPRNTAKKQGEKKEIYLLAKQWSIGRCKVFWKKKERQIFLMSSGLRFFFSKTPQGLDLAGLVRLGGIAIFVCFFFFGDNTYGLLC
jgi:hypothetical protein